jgi:hypothetical protein
VADTIPGQITDLAIAQIQEVFAIAEALKNDAVLRMDTLATSADTLLSALDDLVYDPTFDEGINLTFSPPTIDDTEPDFTGEEPTMPTLSTQGDLDPLDYTDAAYTPEVKTETKAVLTSTLGGTGLISDAAYQGMYDVVEDDLSREQVEAEREATDNGARRGWKLPSEASLARLNKVADITSRNLAKSRLDQVHTQATQRREDIRNAVVDANSFENMWIGEHNAHQQRLLEAATAVVTNGIAISNALIARDDLALKAFGVQWQGILTRTQAVSELWKARLAPAGLEIESERVRHLYETSRLDKGFRLEDGEVNVQIQRVSQLVPHVLGVLTNIAQMVAGLGQAALAASDVGLSTSAPWSYTESHSYCEKACA